jgi:ABC-2 type transport system ATP-binding protein
MAVAKLENAAKRFGRTAALVNASFAVRPGELVALLGLNGAGKSTAVNLLLGLLRPDSGCTRVFGMDPCDRKARIRVGAMLQVAKVPETLRVREHVELFSSYYPAPLQIEETLRRAGAAEFQHKRFGELSGGQRQRTLFALAICGDPDLLILDEPTVGLDVESRRALWGSIRRFVASGRSVLLTTHYLQEAETLADRIVVLARGRIVAEGTPDFIKRHAAASLQIAERGFEDAFLALARGTGEEVLQ